MEQDLCQIFIFKNIVGTTMLGMFKFVLLFCRCDHNRYSMDYIIALSKCKRKHIDDADQGGDESEASKSDSENQDGNLQEVMDSSSDDENFMSNFMETE